MARENVDVFGLNEIKKIVSQEFNITQDNAERMIRRVFSAIMEMMAAETKEIVKVSVPGFGRFTRKIRAAQQKFSPIKQEFVQIPERIVIAFKASAGFKSLLNPAE